MTVSVSAASTETVLPGHEPAAQVALLHERCEELELLLGRAIARIERTERSLDQARAQVAWLHRQLFGSKADRVAPGELQAAWETFRREQEAQARSTTSPKIMGDGDPSPPSYQLLFGLPETASSDLASPPDGEPRGLVGGGARGRTTPDPKETSQEDPTIDGLEPVVAEPDAEGPPPVDGPAGESNGGTKPKRKGHGRKPIPDHLPTVTIRLEPEEAEAPNARRMGAEVSYRLGLRRAEIVRIAVVRERFAIDNEERTESQVVMAPPADEMIPRGLFAPSGLANIIAGKWDFHMPWNRLARFWAVDGYRISVSTLSGVAIRAEPLARDLLRAMETYARTVAPYLAIDATTARILRGGEDTRGYGWVRYIDQVCVLFNFTAKHNSETAGKLLDGWTCPTLADGASVYDAKHRETARERAGCWSHGRRKLVYAAPSDGRALVGVKFINDLFKIEAELLDVEPDVRLRERQQRSQPIVNELLIWRDGLLNGQSLGSASSLAKALRYIRNQEARLTYFLKDGRLPIHNNFSEFQIRHFAIGRKNWLFLGSDPAAEASSTWISLILSARLHGLEPVDYLRDLFRVLPSWPKPRLLELAPHRWRNTRTRLVPTELASELGPLTIPAANV